MIRRMSAVVLMLACVLGTAAAGEPIKIGVVHNSAQAPFYLALDKGYFAAEGLDASIVAFDAAQPVAVAVVSGDITFGSVAATAASTASRGRARSRSSAATRARCRASSSSASSSRPAPTRQGSRQ
jgi:NitT/TauT family transport system substrate-binding protein